MARAILLPTVSGTAACFFWRGLLEQKNRGEKRRKGLLNLMPENNFMVAGIFAGLSLYTYMAARAVPIIFVILVAYLLLTQSEHYIRVRKDLLIFLLLMIVIAAPLFFWL